METAETKKHELKTWPEYYQAIKRGKKTFEIRKYDRPFEIGDKLLLKEYKILGLNNLTQQLEGQYTGEEMELTITYILKHYPMHNNFGLEAGYCIMGFSLLNQQTEKIERLGAEIENDKQEYDKLKHKFDRLKKENERARELFKEMLDNHWLGLEMATKMESFLNEVKPEA